MAATSGSRPTSSAAPAETPPTPAWARGLGGGRLARRLFLLFLAAALLPLLAAAGLALNAAHSLGEDLRQKAHAERTREVSRLVLERLLVARDQLATWPVGQAADGAPDGRGLPGLGTTFRRAELVDTAGTARRWSSRPGDAALLDGWPAAAPMPGPDGFRLVTPGADPSGRVRPWLERRDGGSVWRAEMSWDLLWSPVTDGGIDTRWRVTDAQGQALLQHEPDPPLAGERRRAETELALDGLFGRGGWHFEHEAPREALQWQGLTLGRWMTLLALATALTVALLAHWRIRLIFEPLQALAQGTRRLARGERGARLAKTGAAHDDELAQLALSFDDMAERIDEQLATLRELAAVDHGILAGEPVEAIVQRLLQQLAQAAPGSRAWVLWQEPVREADGSVHERLRAAQGEGVSRALPTPEAWNAVEAGGALAGAAAGTLDDDDTLRRWLPAATDTRRLLLPAWRHGRLQGLIVLEAAEPPRLSDRLGALRDRLAVALATRARDEELAWQARHDSLTGLLNRRGLHDSLDRLLPGAGHRAGLAVLLADLDHFKDLNDSRGHDAGDTMLCEVAARLRALVPADAEVGRLGGDEFVVLLPGADADRARQLANRLCLALTRPVLIDGVEAQVGTSVGVVVSPQHGRTRQELMRRADIALYAAKAERGSVRLFTEELDHATSERTRLLGELRRGLDRGELVLHYQPRLGARDGTLHSVEALVRWQHPERGLLPPGVFVGLAEESGLIDPMGRQVLAMACEQMAAWRREGCTIAQVAVNVSMEQFASGQLPSLVLELLQRHGLPASALELEVTESLLADDAADAQRQLRELREAGVTIALDDFGTGYSAMAQLRSLPLDVMKIDRAFVADLADDEGAAAIVRAILAMADALKLGVVAEGVETAEQAERLASMGCHELQGYHLARPMAPERLREWLAAQPPRAVGDGAAARDAVADLPA